MAEIQQNTGGNGSATSVLVAVIVVLLIGAAFYFGFVRGNWGDRNDDGVNVELNVPTPGGGDGGGGGSNY